jgi:succinoglycan biosynthesis protein ExoA
MPRVSVVVPVRNEAANIRETLEGLINQDFPLDDFEILVVDGCSEDNTVAIVQQMEQLVPNLRLFHNPKRLSSAARNIGILESHGDYIVIIDGHCALTDTHHLTNLVQAFEKSGADSLGRPQPLRSSDATTFQRTVSTARMSWLGHNPDSSIFSDQPHFVAADNVAVAYRREVFEAVGLFDESFDACEDVDFNTRVRRAGFTCYFTPTISVDYQSRRNLKGLFKQMRRYGQGRARLARKEPASISLPSLVPPLWIVWLVVGAAISAFWTPALWLYAASIVFYSSVILLESCRVWLKQRQAPLYGLPIVFASIHAGFAWGYLREIFLGRRGVAVPMMPAVVPALVEEGEPVLLPFPSQPIERRKAG